MEHVLRAVGLQGAAETMIGTAFIKGISGGQRRRLSLAAELLAVPAVLCLDEPTSGERCCCCCCCCYGGGVPHTSWCQHNHLVYLCEDHRDTFEFEASVPIRLLVL